MELKGEVKEVREVREVREVGEVGLSPYTSFTSRLNYFLTTFLPFTMYTPFLSVVFTLRPLMSYA